jgi:hypothetical protein
VSPIGSRKFAVVAIVGASVTVLLAVIGGPLAMALAVAAFGLGRLVRPVVRQPEAGKVVTGFGKVVVLSYIAFGLVAVFSSNAYAMLSWLALATGALTKLSLLVRRLEREAATKRT